MGSAPIDEDVREAPPTPSKKKLCDAYVLAFPLGFLGLHHFYLRRYGFGVLYMLTFGLFGLGWLTDLIRMPHLVKLANEKIENPQDPKKKDLSDAYVLWYPLLGFFGFHHFYLGRYGWGVFHLCTFGFLGVGWLIDGVRMLHLVNLANKKMTENQSTERKTKDVSNAYVLTLLPITGLFGAQHYYLGRYGFGVIYTVTVGLLGVGWLVDVLRMGFLVKRVNKAILEGDMGKRTLDDAYILCFPLGFLGLHHFYLRRYCWGTLYLCTFGLLGVGWIIDWFRLPCLVSECNRKHMKDQMITTALSRPPSVEGQDNLGFINTQSTPPGTYQTPPAYSAQQPAAGYLGALYPHAPPYPGYPGINANDSSWSTTVPSSAVGPGNEEPPSYTEVTSSDARGESGGNSTNQSLTYAPPLPKKGEYSV